MATNTNHSRLIHYGLWVLQLLAALIFLAAGGAKLAGVDQMIEVFGKIGWGQWFRYLTGAVEVIGAVLLIVQNRAWQGALLLAWVMLCAILFHLFVLGPSAVPAAVLFIICGVIYVGRR